MAEETNVLIDNAFGRIMPGRVVYLTRQAGFLTNLLKRLFNVERTAREDIPVRHITGVRFETSPLIAEAMLCFFGGIILGILIAFASKIVGLLIFVVLVGIGVYILLKVPPRVKIVVSTGGGQKFATNGGPSLAKSAEEFVDVLRKEIFK